VQVRHDEGVAIRIDPEPCAVVRKGDGEASVGGRIGQPLSLAKIHILGADAVAKAEGNMDGRVNASVWTDRRGRRTRHVQKLLGREPGDPTSDLCQHSALVRIGRRGAVADYAARRSSTIARVFRSAASRLSRAWIALSILLTSRTLVAGTWMKTFRLNGGRSYEMGGPSL
jgi:hypothetical protein